MCWDRVDNISGNNSWLAEASGRNEHISDILTCTVTALRLLQIILSCNNT